MWAPLLLSLPLVAVVALVLWATADLYPQDVPDAVQFGVFVLLTVGAPVAWAIAAL